MLLEQRKVDCRCRESEFSPFRMCCGHDKVELESAKPVPCCSIQEQIGTQSLVPSSPGRDWQGECSSRSLGGRVTHADITAVTGHQAQAGRGSRAVRMGGTDEPQDTLRRKHTQG